MVLKDMPQVPPPSKANQEQDQVSYLLDHPPTQADVLHHHKSATWEKDRSWAL